MNLLHILIPAIVSATALTACSDIDNNHDIDIPDTIISHISTPGLYIVNQGNFGYANSSISFYSPADNKTTSNLFRTANDMPLGELAQSMSIYGDDAWIVVCNSNTVYKTDIPDLSFRGSINEGLSSPRHFLRVSGTKAYITQLYSNRIAIVDPARCTVTGYIEVPGMDAATGSTEMMIQHGNYVYANCWNYQNSIIRIDTATDRVDASLEVGIQPKSMVIDKDGNLWLLTDGGYQGSPYGHEPPALVKVNTAGFRIDKVFAMSLNDYTPALAINGNGDRLYWICNDIYTMSVYDTDLPDEPLIRAEGNYYYGLTVDPRTSDIYIADALDFRQPGRLLRYNAQGTLIGTADTGIAPLTFCHYTPTETRL